jgi:hypothetical protein
MSWLLSKFLFFAYALWSWRDWRNLSRARVVLRQRGIYAAFAFVGGRSAIEAPYMARAVLRNGRSEAVEAFAVPSKGIYAGVMSIVLGAALTTRSDLIVVLVRPSLWARCLWGHRAEMIRAEQGLEVFGFEKKVVLVPVFKSKILDDLEESLTKAVKKALEGKDGEE